VSALKVLITGGLGSLGRVVARQLLAQGHAVVLTTRSQASAAAAAPAGAHVAAVDFMSKQVEPLLAGVDVVVHMAAALGAHAETPEGFATNAVGPVALMERSTAAGVRRTVFTSSMSVYGAATAAHGNPTFAPVRESHPLRPLTLYGAAKLAAEHALMVLARRQNHQLAMLRFSPYFGADKPAAGGRGLGATVVEAVRAVAEGAEVRLPKLSGYRFDPLYVEDAASAVANAATHPHPLPAEDPVVHVSGGHAIGFDELAAALRALSPTARVITDPTLDLANDAIRRSCMVFDNSRARRLLGYEPKFDLNRALRDCFERFAAVAANREPLGG